MAMNVMIKFFISPGPTTSTNEVKIPFPAFIFSQVWGTSYYPKLKFQTQRLNLNPERSIPISPKYM